MNTTRSHVAEPAFCAEVRARRGVAEVVGTSDESVDAAIDDGMARVTGPGSSVEWVEVTGVRSTVLGGVHRYRVELRLGLRSAA